MVRRLRRVSGCEQFEAGEGGGAAGSLGIRRTRVEGQSGGAHTDTSAHARSDEGLSWKYIHGHFSP